MCKVIAYVRSLHLLYISPDIGSFIEETEGLRINIYNVNGEYI